MKTSTKRRVVIGIILAFLAWLGWSIRSAKTNPYLEALIFDQTGIGAFDPAVRRGEMEAAGELAIPFLRGQLNKESLLDPRIGRFALRLSIIGWIARCISEPLVDSIAFAMYYRNQSRERALETILRGKSFVSSDGLLSAR